MIANVGDSGTDLYRGGHLRQLTRRTRAARSSCRPPTASRAHVTLTERACAGDRLLLCSDGLSDGLGAEVILEGLSLADPREAAEHLVGCALTAGSRDNVSAVVADVVAAPAGVGGWRPAPAGS